ncbi:hypothetical protein TRIUR3_32882 [Triticum urartu]|uniref:DUF3615 domain-containing protein n=1 Tax=Triticum urartu TaxID=4572 RepID=M7YLX1_TRIUA|nr:hypothetical protein TRIUR3_32882 [Triticum urartu]
MFPPGSVEGRQQPQERRSSLPVKIRSSKTKQRMALSLGPETYDTNHVLAWRDPGLPTPVYVRMDSSGVFYTYPTLGDKPLQSLEEVGSAVDSYACPNGPNSNVMSDKMLSKKERAVQEHLYFPNGTSKDLVDELEEIVHWQSICEGVEWYYHLNITVKTKEGADDAGSSSLFFVEVACDSNDITGYYINTFSRVNTDGQDIDQNDTLGCFLRIFCGVNADGKDNLHSYLKYGCAISSLRWKQRLNVVTDYYAMMESMMELPAMAVQTIKVMEAQDEELIKREEKRIREFFEFLDDAEFLENMRCKRLNYPRKHEIHLQSDEEIAPDSDEE